MAFKNRPCHICDLLDRNPALQGFCDLQDGMFPHSIRDQIRTGIDQNTVLDLIFPIIVMCHSSKTGFDPAKNDRRMFIGLPDQIAVYNRSPVRS